MKRGKGAVRKSASKKKKKHNSKLYIGIAIAIVVLLVLSFMPFFPRKTESTSSDNSGLSSLNGISFWAALVSAKALPTPNPSPSPNLPIRIQCPDDSSKSICVINSVDSCVPTDQLLADPCKGDCKNICKVAEVCPYDPQTGKNGKCRIDAIDCKKINNEECISAQNPSPKPVPTTPGKCIPGKECRPVAKYPNGNAKPCDVAEICDSNGNCPPDKFLKSEPLPDDPLGRKTHQCRPSNGQPCSAGGFCDGTGPDCPTTPIFEPSTFVCRKSLDPCKDDVKCDGISDQCPAKDFPNKADGTACKTSTIKSGICQNGKCVVPGKCCVCLFGNYNKCDCFNQFACLRTLGCVWTNGKCANKDGDDEATSVFKLRCNTWLNSQQDCEQKGIGQIMICNNGKLTDVVPPMDRSKCTTATFEFGMHGSGPECQKVFQYAAVCLNMMPSCSDINIHFSSCLFFSNINDSMNYALELQQAFGIEDPDCKLTISANQCSTSILTDTGELDCTTTTTFSIDSSGCSLKLPECNFSGRCVKEGETALCTDNGKPACELCIRHGFLDLEQKIPNLVFQSVDMSMCKQEPTPL